ncbi:MAG: GMC oxidoreductase [Fulvivirga sp.]
MSDNYDLIVAGTSFASSFFLKHYLEQSGSNKKVLILERGKFYPHSDRLAEKRGKIALKIAETKKSYTSDSDKKWVFDPNFGGSSNCWTGCTPRFMPNDFKIKSLYGIGKDWPISYEDLEEYYTEVEETMAISGPDQTPFPKTSPYPLPAHQLSTVDKLLHARYGNRYISQPTARASRAINNRGACCSSAVCNLCPVNAKFTIENGLGPIYKDPRVTLKYDAQVIGLDTNQNIARSVSYTEEGKTKTAFGETFVLGTNAIFNAHILLNSGDRNPNTGTGICEQVGVFARLYYDGLDNVGGGSVITANGYMMYDGAHRKDHAACLIESFNTPFVRNEAGKWRQLSIFKFIFEDLPQQENRIALTGDERTPKIIYNTHSDYAKKGIDKLPENINKNFGFLPVEKIEIDSYSQKTEFHICSTTKMGSNPKDSVIDKNMVHHQYRNVIVLGSGAYPSITPANPTLTLSALSLRAAKMYLT